VRVVGNVLNVYGFPANFRDFEFIVELCVGCLRFPTNFKFSVACLLVMCWMFMVSCKF
jgi:hypothetical protein